MKVVEIPFGAVGLDFLEPPPSFVVAQEIAAYVLPGTRTGVTYVERYLENLSAAEVAWWHSLGVGIAPIGEGRASGWGADAGAADGAREVARARALGFPTGLHLGCDAEAMSCPPDVAQAFLRAWCGPPGAAGHPQRLYVGAGVPLDATQLYGLPFNWYDESLSEVQRVAVVGYASVQLFPTQKLALKSGAWPVDVNMVRRDKHLPARAPTMVVADDWGGYPDRIYFALHRLE